MKKIKLSDKLNMFIEDTTKDQLDKLIKNEEESISLYKDVINSAKSDNERQLFQHILDEETEHLDELKELKRTGEAKIKDSGWPNDFYKIKSKLLDDAKYMTMPTSEIEEKAKEIYFGLNEHIKDRQCITYRDITKIRDSISSKDKTDLMVKLIKNNYSIDDAEYISEIIYKEKN